MTDQERTQYYQRATTWALDAQEATLRSLGRARLVAAAAVLVAVLEAFALLLLTPLKTSTVVPVLVDRQTGFVQVLRPDGRQELESNEALTNSLLVQYVVARESFDITDLAAEYRKVALWSAGAARQDYLAAMPASNPDSPLRRYPRATLVETWVKSVSPLGPHTALVRYDTRRRDQDGLPAPPQEWAAVMEYRFSNEALSASDRWLNPLGFQVVSFHRDAEAPLPPDAAVGTAASNAVAAPAGRPAAVAPPRPAPPLTVRPMAGPTL